MLGLAEYVVVARQLRTLVQDTQDDLMESGAVVDVKARHQRKLEQITDNFYTNIASNAVRHYEELLDLEHDEQLPHTIYQHQVEEKYHGLTLGDRQKLNSIKFDRTLRQVKLQNPKHPANQMVQDRIFDSYYAVEKRLMLGTAIKMEQDAAKTVAVKAGVNLMKWSLSHKHVNEDECDYFAEYEDERVVKYIADKGLNISPKGLYFVEDLPAPPHPNCQCEFGFMSTKGEIRLSPVQKTLKRLNRLLRTFIGR